MYAYFMSGLSTALLTLAGLLGSPLARLPEQAANKVRSQQQDATSPAEANNYDRAILCSTPQEFNNALDKPRVAAPAQGNPADEPDLSLDLIVGTPQELHFKEPPFRIQVANESMLGWAVLGNDPRDLSFEGRQVGSTFLNLFFGDRDDPAKQTVLSYHVNVVCNPCPKLRFQQTVKTLEDEINRAFPDTSVSLQLIKDHLVVSGECRDAAEKAKIVQVIRANIEDKISVINLLRIPGEDMMWASPKIAEVNRDAARQIAKDWSIRNNAGGMVSAQNTSNPGNTVGETMAPELVHPTDAEESEEPPVRLAKKATQRRCCENRAQSASDGQPAEDKLVVKTCNIADVGETTLKLCFDGCDFALQNALKYVVPAVNEFMKKEASAQPQMHGYAPVIVTPDMTWRPPCPLVIVTPNMTWAVPPYPLPGVPPAYPYPGYPVYSGYPYPYPVPPPSPLTGQAWSFHYMATQMLVSAGSPLTKALWCDNYFWPKCPWTVGYPYPGYPNPGYPYPVQGQGFDYPGGY